MATSRVEAFSLTHAQILDGATTFLDALAAAAANDKDIFGVNNSSLSPNTDSYNNEGDDVVMSRWNWLVDADLEVQAGYISFPLIANMTNRPVDNIGGGAAANEVQTLTITATGGTYTLTFNGQTTTAIAWNATAAAVQTALEALSNVAAGDIVVTTAGANRVLTFGGDYAAQDVPLVVVDAAAATGGTVTAAQTTAGSSATPAGFGIDLWHEDDFNVAPKPMIIQMPSKDEDGVIRRLIIGLYKVQYQPITFEGPEYKSGLKVNYNGTALFSPKNELGAAFADGKKRVGRLLSVA